jgi:hypothetical protein
MATVIPGGLVTSTLCKSARSTYARVALWKILATASVLTRRVSQRICVKRRLPLSSDNWGRFFEI